ncbi:thymidylate synthase [Methanococcus maripaludis]|uniref:Thymidylate synthase n=1 Tax=Methanococcus maripaludis TaxID=39152 RepID=A0A7J9NXF1_METMI|nr:thymidylate synthase [Methanococcus maripaludis]MBA2851693.1 thymidylate synthase [Methanococcus maripaludis]
MYAIVAENIKEAYEDLIVTIMDDGQSMITEDGQKCRELENVVIEINNPQDLTVSRKFPLGLNSVKSYADQLLHGVKSESAFVYDYHSRLFKYPSSSLMMMFKNKGAELVFRLYPDIVTKYHDKLLGAERNDECDQIAYTIAKLKSQINSRRAVAITWSPKRDHYEKHVPCMQYIQFLVRDGNMTMTVLFRSNDALLAFHANAIGLVTLGQMVADELGVTFNKYVHHSVSMHIYEERDSDDLKKYFFIGKK